GDITAIDIFQYGVGVRIGALTDGDARGVPPPEARAVAEAQHVPLDFRLSLERDRHRRVLARVGDHVADPAPQPHRAANTPSRAGPRAAPSPRRARRSGCGSP